MDLVHSVIAFIRNGYSDHISDGLAIVIALILVFGFMKSWGQLIMLTITGVVVQEIILWLKPIIMNHQSLHMPQVMTSGYWVQAGYLAAAYFVMIIILFFLKHNVFKMGKSGGGGH